MKERSMHSIEVLGPGCRNCQSVEKIVRDVVSSAWIEAEIVHVTDYAEIAQRGVLSTPGLVIDGRVVVAGRVPTREQVEGWLGVG
jgi:small redox-active disulfide protein 2